VDTPAAETPPLLAPPCNSAGVAEEEGAREWAAEVEVDAEGVALPPALVDASVVSTGDADTEVTIDDELSAGVSSTGASDDDDEEATRFTSAGFTNPK